MNTKNSTEWIILSIYLYKSVCVCVYVCVLAYSKSMMDSLFMLNAQMSFSNEMQPRGDK